MKNQLLSGYAYYIYDSEIENLKLSDILPSAIAGFRPLFSAEGEITLTTREIAIAGEQQVQIPLSSLTQIYLGFDDLYKNSYVKNWGMFWQPLRLVYEINDVQYIIYLVINYNMIATQNPLWYNTLTGLLSGD